MPCGNTQGGLYTPAIMLFSDRYDASRRGRGSRISDCEHLRWICVFTGRVRVMPYLGRIPRCFHRDRLSALGRPDLVLVRIENNPNNIHPRVERLRITTVLQRNRNARLLIAGYTFHCWELLGMWSWTPAFFAAMIAISGNGFGETAQFGAYLVASMHLIGALASVSMGRLADLLGRRVVLIQVAAIGTCLSLVIGWLTTWPIALLVFIGLVYYFFAIGDSPVLSTALTRGRGTGLPRIHPRRPGSTWFWCWRYCANRVRCCAGSDQPAQYGTRNVGVGFYDPRPGRPLCDLERDPLQRPKLSDCRACRIFKADVVAL
jgi:hypothetical protein